MEPLKQNKGQPSLINQPVKRIGSSCAKQYSARFPFDPPPPKKKKKKLGAFSICRGVVVGARKVARWGIANHPNVQVGWLVDFLLKLLFQNGNLLGLINNVIHAHGKVVVPRRGTYTFVSTIGHLDRKIDLYRGQELAKAIIGGGDSMQRKSIIKPEFGNRALMDLCMMASKLAYENAKVIKNIVNHHWKMHFLDFYDCWNDFQKQMSTQVFILCDNIEDANLIIVSFRGTEPFDADDWSTDFDYSCGWDWDQSSDSKTPPMKDERTAYYVVRGKLRSSLNEHKNAKFVVTGHSLGGALAILFPTVLVLHEEREIMKRVLGVYTYGQPRIGNEQLGRFMGADLQHHNQKYYRVVYCNDLVPRSNFDFLLLDPHQFYLFQSY
ncbi:hypothetical protein K1719_011181 [Acacia pycnantha]|nr:hypothetical protein K1719_011181 [Acacia pycnantha]